MLVSLQRLSHVFTFILTVNPLIRAPGALIKFFHFFGGVKVPLEKTSGEARHVT